MDATAYPTGAEVVRSTYGLADGTPEPVRVAACREALSVLRPRLSRIWISALPAGRSWPPELDGDGVELLRRWAQEQETRPPVARRPGAGPDVVGMDPADSGQFTLAHRLAPYSASVAAMSRPESCHLEDRLLFQGL